MACIDLTIDNYNDALNEHEVLIIHFCVPSYDECSESTTTFDKLTEKHADIVFAKVDTQENAALAAKFAIKEVPTMAVAREGVMVYKEDGVVLSEDDLNYVIQKVKELDMATVHAEVKEMQKSTK